MGNEQSTPAPRPGKELGSGGRQGGWEQGGCKCGVLPQPHTSGQAPSCPQCARAGTVRPAVPVLPGLIILGVGFLLGRWWALQQDGTDEDPHAAARAAAQAVSGQAARTACLKLLSHICAHAA